MNDGEVCHTYETNALVASDCCQGGNFFRSTVWNKNCMGALSFTEEKKIAAVETLICIDF